MAKNLVEAVQQRLGYAPLEKVDPNIQDAHDKHSSSQKLAQAAIPAVLTAIYRQTRTESGCQQVLDGNLPSQLLPAAENIARYAGVTPDEAQHQIETIAKESVGLLRETAARNNDLTGLKNYMSNQRHNILVYLPAGLQMGDLLNDEGLDDRTNKMEGPVSNFMHKIEDNLSGGGRK